MQMTTGVRSDLSTRGEAHGNSGHRRTVRGLAERTYRSVAQHPI
ncbi:hypothetical protein PAMC26577_36950 [Caballeronia sordidicola]|uniref:Uncharacterized protein n=1 Tax=Caballeronia sordidicola TaxID=196367 RepID=A0A242M7L5_CABSO|nr:hypothetical protein PAMC26577_36950 [Caballeronia sordidicola]